ncbi:MAG: FixH family protein [Salibacteraceae bacterium]
MRFTWGHAAIAIPVTIVVVFTSVLIRSMADDKKTELVTEDYYAKEIQFQDQLDRVKNALELNTNFTWTKSEDSWVLGLSGDFTHKEVKGVLTVFRPSDSSLDFEIPIQLDSNFKQVVSASKFVKGKYQIQVKWTVNGKECYLEKNVFV